MRSISEKLCPISIQSALFGSKEEYFRVSNKQSKNQKNRFCKFLLRLNCFKENTTPLQTFKSNQSNNIENKTKSILKNRDNDCTYQANINDIEPKHLSDIIEYGKEVEITNELNKNQTTIELDKMTCNQDENNNILFNHANNDNSNTPNQGDVNDFCSMNHVKSSRKICNVFSSKKDKTKKNPDDTIKNSMNAINLDNASENKNENISLYRV